ncbi:ral GTPase-activating protein subunit beta-like isoform X2 [Oppia nitens]|uniref:ral GTPase-activating protein subunit beta-like isoform X2 n=1 Tax=Oppia nitens TaxID=1686743 RepID=UPI0023DBCC70|nr:ral GTPase-activating protein subunit beta-like isoform X2 [Oppia nitens]
MNGMPSSKSMYTEWSVFRVVDMCEASRVSVLHKMPQINGTLLVTSCVKPLAQMLNNTNVINNTTEDNDFLQNDRDVLWIMEVICYGLSLPLTSGEQHDCVRDCVSLYSEWLYALSPQLAKSKVIPFPIRDDPNLYCRKILEHIYNIFIARPVAGNEAVVLDAIQRQAVLCHRLLRTIENIVQDEHNLMDRQFWDSLLIFLLAINDTLLSPPVETNDIGTQISDRIINVLFEIWLIACCRCFPSPSFWKTFQHLSSCWRHRPALIDTWNRVNYSLTLRLVKHMSPNSYDINANSPTLQKNYLNVILDEMNEETLKQCWYRFLHCIGNPVDLCSPEIISKTDRFYHSACASENVVDPRQHPCLNNLPHIFYKSMKGLSVLVDTFLGIPVTFEEIDVEMYKSSTSLAMSSAISSIQPPPTPPERRKPAFPALTINKTQNKGMSSKHTVTTKAEPNVNPLPTIIYPTVPEYILPPTRPKSTSILDILGDWLFQAALFGSDLKENEMIRSNSSQSFSQINELQRKQSAASDRLLIETLPLLGPESFEAGQAEAIGALCRLFCFKKADEEISTMLNKQPHPPFQKVKNYLTQFHLALQFGLSLKETFRRQFIASILINSTKIFEVDLPGGSLLIPHYLKALEIYLIPKEKPNTKPDVEIRRSCIKLLLSLFSYPLHFNELPIKETLSETPSTTFQSLRPRLINLQIQALCGETDSINVQMILGGFLLMVSDVSNNELFNQNENSDSSLESMRSNSLNDTARGLFGRALSQVGQVLARCRDKSQYDSQVSLAALEVLSVIGRINLSNDSKYGHHMNCLLECKDTVKQIYAFIESQCEKPAPFHSKDLHSTIVAAYQCLAVWFHQHSHLLREKDCISMLLEVIELGISGSKSKKNGFVFKADKPLKPASMRVREAAESLLTLLMNHFNNCPPTPCPPESIIGSTLLDECNLLKYLSIGKNLSPESACDRFKYFVSDNLIMIAILDILEPNDKQTVCIIRSPFGKYCWSFTFRQLSRKHNMKTYNEVVARPLPKPDSMTNILGQTVRQFPESLDKIKSTKFDSFVPNLTKMIAESPEFRSDRDIMTSLIERVENHMKYEKQRAHKIPLANRSLECKEPMPSTETEAARLILSHFSFLSFETLQDAPMGQMIPSLIALNSKSADFVSNLKILDSISNRTSDTAFVYYIKQGVKSADEILADTKQQIISNNQFKSFVLSLGSVVDVKNHSGWTGHISTAWKIIQDCNVKDHEKNCVFDAKRHVLYWADVSHELVFVLPSSFSSLSEDSDNQSLDGDYKQRVTADFHLDTRSVSSLSDDGSNTSKNITENESTRNSLRRKFRNQLLHNVGCDVKVLIFWMESTDDHYDLPINSLLLTTGTGVESNLSLWKDFVLILIHPLKNGLFRIILQGSGGRTPITLPLIDGMVVSKHILGTFVRLAALNVCRRRRLDTESFQPPHVKRRLKIQEIVNKYRLLLPESEFYNSLFTSK